MTASTEDSKTAASPRALERARAEALAAFAIAATPECSADTAARHVVDAWRWLKAAADGDSVPSELEGLADWAQSRVRAVSNEAKADSTRRLVEGWLEQSEATTATQAAVRGQVESLRRVLDEQSRSADATPSPKRRALVWAARFGGWVVLAVAAFLIALRPWELVQLGPWRGAYYPGKDLRGDPDLRRAADLSFDWGRDPPTDSIPSDRFGAAFDTCLVMDAEQEVAFQLIVDDGGKLFIDGELVIDAWKIKPPGTKGAKKKLAAGVHHLRVEYREESKGALVHLRASFDPEIVPGPIPARMLEYPGDELDEDDPCGHVSP